MSSSSKTFTISKTFWQCFNSRNKKRKTSTPSKTTIPYYTQCFFKDLKRLRTRLLKKTIGMMTFGWLDEIKDTKVTLKLLTHPPPSRMETKDSFINLKLNYFKAFTLRIESFFEPLKPRSEKRNKVNFREEPQRRSYTIINFPSSQNCHSLRTFSQFREQGRTAGG